MAAAHRVRHGSGGCVAWGTSLGSKDLFGGQLLLPMPDPWHPKRTRATRRKSLEGSELGFYFVGVGRRLRECAPAALSPVKWGLLPRSARVWRLCDVGRITRVEGF